MHPKNTWRLQLVKLEAVQFQHSEKKDILLQEVCVTGIAQEVCVFTLLYELFYCIFSKMQNVWFCKQEKHFCVLDLIVSD